MLYAARAFKPRRRPRRKLPVNVAEDPPMGFRALSDASNVFEPATLDASGVARLPVGWLLERTVEFQLR